MSEEVCRTRYPKQRDFVRFVLRRDWSDIHRVKMGDNKSLESKSIALWCGENISQRWSRSDGNEVYYFESLADATYFRLRWTGSVPETAGT